MLETFVREIVWLNDMQKAMGLALLFSALLLLTSFVAVVARMIGYGAQQARMWTDDRVSLLWEHTYSVSKVTGRSWRAFPPAAVVERLKQVRLSVTDKEDHELIRQTFASSRGMEWLMRRSASLSPWARAVSAENMGLVAPARRRVVKRLRLLVFDRLVMVRVRALRALVRLGAHLPVEPLVRALEDADGYEALVAADALLGSNPPIMHLAELARSVKTARGAELVLRCMAVLSHAPTMDLLARALDSPARDVRLAALLAAQNSYDNSPVSLVRRAAFYDIDPRVRETAIRVLAEIMGDASTYSLEVAFSDPSHLVRQSAAETAYRTLGSVERMLARFSGEPAVQHVADLCRLGILARR